jgi:hypothetical protein
VIHCSSERKVIEGVIYTGKITLKKKKIRAQQTRYSAPREFKTKKPREDRTKLGEGHT